MFDYILAALILAILAVLSQARPRSGGAVVLRPLKMGEEAHLCYSPVPEVGINYEQFVRSQLSQIVANYAPSTRQRKVPIIYGRLKYNESEIDYEYVLVSPDYVIEAGN